MAKKLWGGRFKKKTNPLVEEFTKSIDYDQRLAEYDVICSKVHVHVLKRASLLTTEEAHKLLGALNTLSKSIEKGTFEPDKKSEDIHTDIQNALQMKVGDLTLKLHTARSRNEQVVLATKMYCKAEISKLAGGIAKLENTICKLAKKNRNVIIPGFTHMQHAQPIYLSDYFMAYIEMLERDCSRLKFIAENIKITMGSGALAGTPINALDYNIKGLIEDLQPAVNSVDAVSDRDFAIEILSALSILGMHLSRLAEDLTIWSTKEFDFIEMEETFCTGSSLMPQKKNPDVLELVRGYTGKLYGNLVSVLTMMKGLPLAYNRDMQLDKEPLFGSFDIIFDELEVLTGLIKSLKLNKKKIEEHLKDESLYSTDLVYYLVKKDIPFTKAHNIVGKLVRYSINNSKEIKNMTAGELKRFSDKFVKKDIVKLFDPVVSVKSKKSVKRKKYA